MRRRFTTLLSLLVLTMLFVSACQSASTPTQAEPLPTEIPALQTPAAAAETTAAPPAVETPAEIEELRRTVGDQTAILAFNQEFDMLNPLYAQTSPPRSFTGSGTAARGTSTTRKMRCLCW